MNISYNPTDKVFTAEFSSDFQGDLDACKNAKFRTTGPPDWIWFAPPPGIKALNRLRANRPASGLTISPEALAIYTPLAALEVKNEEVRKQLAEVKKKQKKEKKTEKKTEENTNDSVLDGLTEEKWWIDTNDLPPLPPFVPNYSVSQIKPVGICRTCGDSIYGWPDLEFVCLWCEMKIDEQLRKEFENKT